MGMLYDLPKDPERLLCIDDQGRQIRYRELFENIRFFENEIGHQPVFILCRNRPGSLLAYLGALLGGSVPLLLDAGMDKGLLKQLYEIYQPAYLCIPESQRMQIHEFIPGHVLVRRIRESMLLSSGLEGPALHPSLALLMTTSGSTGSPKLVRISQENLVSNTASICEYLHIDEAERPITTLPMHYSYGMSVINSHISKGAAILLTEYSLMEQAFWDRLEKENASSLAGVPFTYQMLKRLKITERALPALKTLTQAGGKLPADLQQYFAGWCQKTGRKFYVMYGQTEASPRMSFLPPELALIKTGSIGHAIPGGQFYLEGVHGEHIDAPETAGELIYQGKNVSMGYAECRADLAKGDENFGTLRTGDMAMKDKDGCYYITGRRKRFIKLLGVRTGLDETEAAICQEFPEITCACAGEDDMLQVFVCTGTADIDLVRDHLTNVLHLPGRLVRVRQIDDMPRTSSGKTDYVRLLQI